MNFVAPNVPPSNLQEPSTPPSSTPPIPQSSSLFYQKPQHSPILIGVLCGVIGLVVGGLSIFGIIKLSNPEPEPSCCVTPLEPEQPKIPNNLTTSFLSLEPERQNVIYSPLSIRYGLSLLNEGAGTTTKAEIEKILGNETLPVYQNIQDQMSLANGIFIRDNFSEEILPAYTDYVAEAYDADVIYDSFENATNIDKWVKNKTFNLIDDTGIEVTPATEMVLANALAIQMNWQHQFDSDDTHGASFYKNDDTEIEATTLTQVTTAGDVSYYTDDDVTLLSLPLAPTAETALEFVAVMPSGDLADYIKTLDLKKLQTKLYQSTTADNTDAGVLIRIPKFNFDYELQFMDDLKRLGVTEAFTGAADFSNMASTPLYVSNAIHKANIDFSEDGIKAAAVTAFVLMETAVMEPGGEVPKPVEIIIDHPFLFLIRDQEDGTLWFVGAVYEPNLWENDAASYRK